MDDIINTSIPSELHPGCVEGIEGFEDPAIAELLGPTQTAFSAAYIGINKIFEARALAKKNPALTEASQILQTADYAAKVIASISKRFDTVNNNLAKTITHLEGELSAPIVAKAAGSIASEVRAHFKGSNTSQRSELIRQAIAEGDHIVATAVLGAPAILSGFTNDTMMLLIRHYHQVHNPDTVKKHAALSAAKKMIDDRAGLVFTTTERAIGVPTNKVKALRNSRDASEKAFSLAAN